MDKNEARSLVVDYLATIPRRGKNRWVIAKIEDLGDLWIFYWTTSRNFGPRNLNISLPFNSPIAVRKSDGLARIWAGQISIQEFADRVRFHPETLPRLPKSETEKEEGKEEV